MRSIQKKDFTDPGLVENENCKPDEISNSNGIQLMGAPFPKQTNYNTDYIDWEQKEPLGIIKPSNLDRSKFKLPFHGKPSNSEYGNFPMEDALGPLQATHNFGKYNSDNPLAPKTGFNGTTCYTDDYIPFDNSENFGNQSCNKPKKSDNIANAKAFPGRFKSTYKDFKGEQMNNEGICPAKKVLGGVRHQVDKLGLHESFRF